MFVRNCWYVAGFSSHFADRPVARTLLGEPVVLFRGQSGTVAALEDRCCHRNLPLSFGAVRGDCIACGYHGLVYDRTGRCVQVPGQEAVPASAKVRSFPVVERDEVVWIWMGEAAEADTAAVPAYPFHGDAHWAHKGDHYLIEGNYQLIHDNLLDLSHVGYVHGKTIGGTPAAHSEAETATVREPGRAIVRRWMRNSVPPPTYVRAVGFAGRIDRWMEITFVPGLITIYIGANDVGRGLDEAGCMDRLGIRIFNGVTPETARSSHYFWTAAHNFNADHPDATEAFSREIAATFEEDRVIVEAQQRMFERFPDRPTVHIRSDAGGVHARQVVSDRIAAEALRTAA